MDMKRRLYEIVFGCVEEYNEQHLRKIPIQLGQKAPLYGNDGLLDSIGLITLLVCVEQEVEEQLGMKVPLIQQSLALSTKDSPFKTVENLVGLLNGLLESGTPEKIKG